MGIFSALQTAAMARSPCSLAILTILSTAKKREFHLVAFGLKSWSLQVSSMISAAVILHFYSTDSSTLRMLSVRPFCKPC